MKAPPCPTAHKALAAAITRAMEYPLAGRLTEAEFTRYTAVDAGWGFRLVFAYEVREEGGSENDALARRVEFIVERWEKGMAQMGSGGR